MPGHARGETRRPRLHARLRQAALPAALRIPERNHRLDARHRGLDSFRACEAAPTPNSPKASAAIRGASRGRRGLFLSNLQFVDPGERRNSPISSANGTWRARTARRSARYASPTNRPATKASCCSVEPGCDPRRSPLRAGVLGARPRRRRAASQPGRAAALRRQQEGGWAKVPDTPRPLVMRGREAAVSPWERVPSGARPRGRVREYRNAATLSPGSLLRSLSPPSPTGRGDERIHGISRNPFRLACPSLPTMMWSWTSMPSGRATSTICLRHLDVGARRRRIAGGMIVHEDDGGGR